MKLTTADPHILRILHIGGYWRGTNDMVRQMMLGLRQAGAEVTEYNTDDHREALETDGQLYDRGTTSPVWLSWEHLAPVIDDIKPHLIICNAGGLSFRPEVSDRLRRSCTLLGIALSDPEVFEPTTRHIARHFDLFLTCAPELMHQYEASGARCGLLPVATNEQFFHPVAPREEMRCDVLIMGRVLSDRVTPVKRLTGEFNVHLYGEGWEQHGLHSRGLCYGDDALAALNSAAISVLFLNTPTGHPLPKVGLFDFTAAGALVAASRVEAFRHLFEFENEIITFADTDELLNKVRYYLDHPAAAALIRKAGRRRTLGDHTWAAEWRTILAALASDTAY